MAPHDLDRQVVAAGSEVDDRTTSRTRSPVADGDALRRLAVDRLLVGKGDSARGRLQRVRKLRQVAVVVDLSERSGLGQLGEIDQLDPLAGVLRELLYGSSGGATTEGGGRGQNLRVNVDVEAVGNTITLTAPPWYMIVPLRPAELAT